MRPKHDEIGAEVGVEVDDEVEGEVDVDRVDVDVDTCDDNVKFDSVIMSFDVGVSTFNWLSYLAIAIIIERTMQQIIDPIENQK